MKILGIFRGFPGLGRVVSGVSILETLREKYGYDIKIISYLQGNKYLATKNYKNLTEATDLDISSIGLLPTNKMGVHIHNTIQCFKPDLVLIDGEPLIIQSIKISHPQIKIIALLNPSDIDNPSNDQEAMDYFRYLYALADFQIIHGLRQIHELNGLNAISTGTIIRKEIVDLENHPTKNIFCLLGGGTVNAGKEFIESTISIAEKCVDLANYFSDYNMNIVCSDQRIYSLITRENLRNNIIIHKDILDAAEYYTKAALVITRAGRNTLSELLYLKIPSIAFVSGCDYRKQEQSQNIANLNSQNIISAFVEDSIEEIASKCKKLLNFKSSCEEQFEPGNEEAIKTILSFTK